MNIYQNPASAIETRVEDLLSRMELDEKIAQMHALWLFLAEDGGHEVRSDRFTGKSDAESINAMLGSGLGQITRPLGTRAVNPRQGVRALNCLQKFLIEETRLSIPVIAHADYIGVSLLHSHHDVAADKAEAAALAFNAGLDVELPGDDCALHVREALDRGLITVDTIEGIVRRVLREKFRLGLFENPYTDDSKVELQSKSATDLACKVAEQAITILDNDGTLPLTPGKTIALIGPTANDPLAMLGDYSFPAHLINHDKTEDTGRIVTPLEAFRTVLGEDKAIHAQGCYIMESRGSGNPVFPGDVADNTNLSSQYPFGHGHSYTNFDYRTLSLNADIVDFQTGTITLFATIHNTGKRAGIEVPQLYVRDKVASLVRPVKELKGFGRVSLESCQAARITFTLPVDMLNFTGYDGVRIVEPGDFELMLGASSSNIKLRTLVRVTGTVRKLPRNWRMESQFTAQHL